MNETSYFNPKNWFLSDKEKRILHAKRHFYGESLQRALNDLTNDANSYAHDSLSLGIDLEFKRISQYEYDKKSIELIQEFDENKDDATQIAFKLALLDVERKHGKITDQEYQKQKATINNEPWVIVAKVVMDPTKPTEGFMELDWNEQFVQTLLDAGYTGESKDMVVQKWFDTICHNIAKENGAIFPAESEKPEEFTYKAAVRKVQSEDGRTEIV